MSNEPCCEYCELGKPVIAIHPDLHLRQKLAKSLRFTAERTITHDAAGLVLPDGAQATTAPTDSGLFQVNRVRRTRYWFTAADGQFEQDEMSETAT